MGNPYSDLFSNLEQAAAGLGASLAGQYNFFKGQDNAEITLPAVLCIAEPPGEEDPPNSGVFWVDLEIQCVTSAPVDADGVDTRPARDLMVKTVFDIFMSPTLAADLNVAGIADFTAQGVRYRVPGFHTQGDQWINSLKVQVLCCASTLAG